MKERICQKIGPYTIKKPAHPSRGFLIERDGKDIAHRYAHADAVALVDRRDAKRRRRTAQRRARRITQQHH